MSVTFVLGVITELCGGSSGVTPEVLLFGWLALHFRAARPLLVCFAILSATLITDIIALAVYKRSDAANVFAAFSYIAKAITAWLCYVFVTRELAERVSLLWTGGAEDGAGGAKSLTEAEGESPASSMEAGGAGGYQGDVPAAKMSASPQLAGPTSSGGYQGSYQ